MRRLTRGVISLHFFTDKGIDFVRAQSRGMTHLGLEQHPPMVMGSSTTSLSRV